MADYKDIKPLPIQSFSSDPPNTIEGQVWFNTTQNKAKYNAGTPRLAWVTKAPTVLGNAEDGKGVGTLTSALYVGTGAPESSAAMNVWNGSSWTSAEAFNNDSFRRQGNGASGSNANSAFAWGGLGYDPQASRPKTFNDAETWNGTSWTAAPSVPAGSYYGGSAGNSVNVTLGWGGGYTPPTIPPPTAYLGTTYSYNGSSWTNLPAVQNKPAPTSYQTGGTGTSTAAISVGGNGFSRPQEVEFFNGTNWTVGTQKNTFFPIGSPAQVVSGDQNNCISTGGIYKGNTVEAWNGSSWSSLPQGIGFNPTYQGMAGGSTTSALVFCGSPGLRDSFALETVGGVTDLE